MDDMTRRTALIAASAVAAFAAIPAQSAPQAPTGAPDDFKFLFGRWTVRHHRLKGRLVGSTEWEDFAGSAATWPTMDGLGTIDDNVIDIPSGRYRAVGIRAFDPKARRWAIWWLDERYPTAIEPPVYGGFKDGVGVFVGADTLNGKPILVRFEWSKISATTAHWEQAFSPDDGRTWEVNWRMDFTRVA